MNLAGCQINFIDVNFHLRKVLKIFDKKNELTKSDPNRTRSGKCPSSCQLGSKLQSSFLGDLCPLYVKKILWSPLALLVMRTTESNFRSFFGEGSFLITFRTLVIFRTTADGKRWLLHRISYSKERLVLTPLFVCLVYLFFQQRQGTILAEAG